MLGRRTFRELSPAGKRQVVIFYCWLAAITILLVILILSSKGESAGQVQAQRRSGYIASCKTQNRKHHTLFRELREQRQQDAALRGRAYTAAALNDSRREALIETLEPWQDCTALAKLRVH